MKLSVSDGKNSAEVTKEVYSIFKNWKNVQQKFNFELEQQIAAMKVSADNSWTEYCSNIETINKLRTEIGKLESKSLCDDYAISKFEEEIDKLKRALKDWRISMNGL